MADRSVPIYKTYHYQHDVNAKGEPKFKSSLAKGGIPVVNQFAKRARDLLLDYYLRSEAYYNNGVSMMEKNLKALSFTL